MENRELEKQVLSIISMDNKILLDSEINEDYFTTPLHKKLFKLLKTYDNIAVIQWKLEESELNDYYDIMSIVANTAQRAECVEQLKEIYERRKYYNIARSIEIACKSKEPIKKIKNKVEEFETEEIRKETKQEVLQWIWDIMLWTREFVFYETWYQKLDELIVWFVPGQLNVIAARPSVWKTMFGMNVMLNQRKKWKKVAYFSLEMSAMDIYQRIVANLWGFSMYETRKEAKQSTIEKFWDACELLFDNDNIEVVDWIVDLQDIIKEIRYLNRKKWTEIFFIDYLGIIQWEGENRNMEITKTTRALKLLAIKLNVVIVIASQLSRDIEKRWLKEPLLSDLRDSWSIEQDADVVIMLHRDLEDSPRELHLYVRKNRNGSVWELELDCEGRIMMIHDRKYEKMYEDALEDKPF